MPIGGQEDPVMNVSEQFRKAVELEDGTQVILRPIKPTDDELMLELFDSFSEETIHLRFFSFMKNMPKDRLEKFTHIDYEKQMAIVALVDEGDRERIVAVGRYSVLPSYPYEAEFAVVVQDSYQRRGIGTEVLQHLVHIARHKGVRVVVADVMQENYRIFALLRKSGLSISKKNWEDGIMRVEIPI
jgi:acetyltransferase